MPSQHCILSPSSSHRWLNCSAAPMLEKQIEDKSSRDADTGTLAHAICEAKLRSYLTGGKKTPEEIFREAEGADWHDIELYDPDMEDSSEYYHDTVVGMLEKSRETTPDAKLLIEQRLDFSEWIPEGFGTSDAVIVADGEMNVIDYKNGKGVEVSAYKNPQMMIYALGALERFNIEYNITRVKMTIIQPRLYNTSVYSISTKELLEWARETLKPAAEKAFGGVQGTNDVEQHAGEWCRFCKIRKHCAARADMALQTHNSFPDKFKLTPEKIAEILPLVAEIKTWCTDIDEYALQLAQEGTEINGYKIVEGRSIRFIQDPEALVKKLKDNGYDEALLYKPKELQTITNLEKIVGKKKFAEYSAGLIQKPQGKPTLVPNSDKRPAMNSVTNDFAHLTNLN